MKQYFKVIEVIKNFVSNKSERFTIFPNIDSMGIEDILLNLNELFSKEDDEIEKEHKKKFKTDNYENGVRYFAIELVRSLLPHHNELEKLEKKQGFKEYSKLLSQRHIAYSHYHLHNIYNNHLGNLDIIIKDSSYKKNLYLGLVMFYKKFYGKFHDNEEAIKLLCNYYPENIDLSNEREDIVYALFRHITNAGMQGDSGFAYNGIGLIKEYIGKLPIEVIKLVLNKYELSNIIYNKVYRCQIFYIIEYSSLSIEKKKIYKFHYIDSLMLANKMNLNLYEKYKGENSQPYILSFHENFSKTQINVIKYNETNNARGYWTNHISIERSFIVDEKSVITIRLNLSIEAGQKEQIYITDNNKPRNKIHFLFKYVDWTLDVIQSKETEQKLLNFISNNEQSKITYRSLTFSLLYLNNFRGMNDQLIDFDHKFKYSNVTKKLDKSSIDSVIPHFYSENIYSLTCIVGKNGTGKTSTVDFLKDTFFKLINLINNYNLSCENGHIKEVNYSILDKDCEFLVVFCLGDEPYILTNIENIENVSGISVKPFNKNVYTSENELSKVAYFSSMLSSNLEDIYINNATGENEKSLAKSLNNYRHIDYSEAVSFIEKRKRLEETKENSINSNRGSISKEVCYYVSFLHHLIEKDKIYNYLDFLEEKKEIVIKSNSLSEQEKILLDKKIPIEKMINKVKPFITVPDSMFGYFSSGQYAKFSFLVKLYWLLEGYRKYSTIFEKELSEFEDGKITNALQIDNLFSRDEAILDDETALIFIDEGELYYHPEWQRLYIKTLIDTIRDTDKRFKLQVVLTTNSPFIISDILRDDIIYLSKENKLSERPLGQNIHKLLMNNFFMSYTIGEYSRTLIENIIIWLSKKDEKDENINVNEQINYYFGEDTALKSEYDKIYSLINEIGEPVYREKLLSMLDKSKIDKKTRLEKLSRQLAEIEREMKELKES